MKSSLQNYIQAIPVKVKHSNEAYHPDVEDDITSLKTALSQDVRESVQKVPSVLMDSEEKYLGQVTHRILNKCRVNTSF